MAAFGSRPFRARPSLSGNISQTLKKHPSYFGVPFVLLMVAGSFGLQTLTQTRYDLHEQKVSQASTEFRTQVSDT